MESEEFDQYRGDLDAISQKQIEIAEQLGLTKEDVLNLSAKYTDDTDIDNLTSRVLELLSKTEKAQNWDKQDKVLEENIRIYFQF